jgi:hydrogenase maturation factor
VKTRILGAGKLPGDLLGDLLSNHTVTDPSVIVGPGVGMDAAAIDVGDSLLVVKTDPITFARERAPHYLINVNANDLACMGATPRWLLVTALLPLGQTTVGTVSDLFVELQQVCALRGISLVGGHTEILDGLDRPILVGSLLGTAKRDELIQPGNARPGDRLLLTRPIAIEGTALLANELGEQFRGHLSGEQIARCAALLDDPGISIQRDAEVLRSTGGVSALHDPTEGGLAMGVRELALAAGTGVMISRMNVPVLPETALVSEALGLDPLGMLASGSLLAAVPADDIERVERACRENEIPFAWIGKITPHSSGFVLRSHGAEHQLPVFNTDEVARAMAAFSSDS